MGIYATQARLLRDLKAVQRRPFTGRSRLEVVSGLLPLRLAQRKLQIINRVIARQTGELRDVPPPGSLP